MHRRGKWKTEIRERGEGSGGGGEDMRRKGGEKVIKQHIEIEDQDDDETTAATAANFKDTLEPPPILAICDPRGCQSRRWLLVGRDYVHMLSPASVNGRTLHRPPAGANGGAQIFRLGVGWNRLGLKDI